MRMTTIQQLTVTPTKPAPLPPTPPVPQEILGLADKPLFSAKYTGTERATWHDGIPLIGKKVTSTRDVAFSNDFNILRTGEGPMIGHAASSYDDAVRSASNLAFDWSDPALGGQIYASVGVAVLQAKDGAYFSALVGTGNPNTSASALSYRSDRFDSNILGSIRQADDAHATSKWSAPVDKHGNPVDDAPPADDRGIKNRKVDDVKLADIVAATPMLKAIVDVNSVYKVD
jgi:hypothetical protein